MKSRRIGEPLGALIVSFLGLYLFQTPIDFSLPEVSIDPIHLYHPGYIQFPAVVLVLICLGSFLVEKPVFYGWLPSTDSGWIGWWAVGLWLFAAVVAGLTGIMVSAQLSLTTFTATVFSAGFVQVMLWLASVRIGLIKQLCPRFSRNVFLCGVISYLRWLPVLFAASWLNYLLVEWLELEASTPQSLSFFAGADSMVEKAIFFLLIVGVAPFCEELFFRGTLYRLFRELLHIRTAALLSGFIFSLIHQEVLWILPVWVLGYALAREYETSAHLGVPMVMHACQNALSFCLLMYLLS